MDSSCFKIPTEGYQDSRHQLQALLTEQGLDGCLMQGHNAPKMKEKNLD